MAREKRWAAVPPQLFTSDGSVDGQILVVDASLFKVKQVVVVASSTQSPVTLEVKRVDDIHTLYVGPVGGSIDLRANISAYTIVDGANISAAEQNRSTVPEQAVERLTYEEEPTVARRVVLVDKLGNKVDSGNPFPTYIVNKLIKVDYDELLIAYKNLYGDPTLIRILKGGIWIASLFLIYDSDLDLQDIKYSDTYFPTYMTNETLDGRFVLEDGSGSLIMES